MLGFFSMGKREPARTPAAQPAAAAPATAVAAAPAPAAPAAAKMELSERAAGVLKNVYTAILSAELRSGVYQVEYGSLAFFDDTLPQRGYYDALLERMTNHILPAQGEVLAAQFGRSNLYARLSGGQTSASGDFCFYKQEIARGENDEPGDCSWMHVTAIVLSAAQGGPVRCALFFRRVRDAADNGLPEQAAPSGNSEMDLAEWERLRTRKLMGGKQVMFFEYEIEKDTLTIHRMPGSPQHDRVVQHYLGSLSERCDWTVFHDDVNAVRNLLKKGKTDSIEIHYRVGGEYQQPFHWHRMHCAPLEDTGTPTIILGALTDIDEEVALREKNRNMAVQIGMLIEGTYSRIYEIDTQRGTLARIVNIDGSYQKEKKPDNLIAKIRKAIQNEDIHPESVKHYELWLSPGYLERVTSGGATLSFDGHMKSAGDTDYRWYAESITCPDPVRAPHVFLRLARDVTEQRLQRIRNQELQERMHYAEYNLSMLDALANVVEFRSIESGQHIQRVRTLTGILLTDIAKSCPQYGLTATKVKTISEASAMHDVGKIAIPDAVLNKPGRLTPDEFTLMKTHTTRGAEILAHINLAWDDDLKEYCRDIALHHHERYDGRGYPDGLKGEENSIAAQAVGLADAYDALVSERCYKKAFTHSEALLMLQQGDCGAFNKALVQSLFACAGLFRAQYEEPSSPAFDANPKGTE